MGRCQEGSCADEIVGADKPSQQSGTLPSLPVTKSFLKRDAVSKSRLTPQNRVALIEILAGLLEDEYKLATESDTYQRTSFASENNTSRPPSFTSHPSTSGRTSFTSKSSYTTACETRVTTARSAASMAKKKVKKETVQPASPKNLKREALQPQQTVGLVGLETLTPS